MPAPGEQTRSSVKRRLGTVPNMYRIIANSPAALEAFLGFYSALDKGDVDPVTRERIASIPPEAIRPAPLVSGDDLIAAGYEPGPRFKEILSLVEDAQLEGRLPSKEIAMEYVRQKFPRLGGHNGQN